jgi:hypothetical protein
VTRYAAIVLVHFFFLVGATTSGAAPGEPSPRVKKFLGEPTVKVLQGATRVETFRLKDERADDEGKPNVGRYAIASTGKAQGEPFARRLAAILLDEHTYVFDSAKGCKFQPAVGFRIWKGDESSVEVVICFHCDELIVHSPKAADGSIRGAMENFDPARPALVKLAKEAFPDDKEIQGLNG